MRSRSWRLGRRQAPLDRRRGAGRRHGPAPSSLVHVAKAAYDRARPLGGARRRRPRRVSRPATRHTRSRWVACATVAGPRGDRLGGPLRRRDGGGACIVVVVGATRVYLRVHHLTDVIGGAALGVAIWALVGASRSSPGSCVKMRRRRDDQRPRHPDRHRRRGARLAGRLAHADRRPRVAFVLARCASACSRSVMSVYVLAAFVLAGHWPAVWCSGTTTGSRCLSGRADPASGPSALRRATSTRSTRSPRRSSPARAARGRARGRARARRVARADRPLERGARGRRALDRRRARADGRRAGRGRRTSCASATRSSAACACAGAAASRRPRCCGSSPR